MLIRKNVNNDVSKDSPISQYGQLLDQVSLKSADPHLIFSTSGTLSQTMTLKGSKQTYYVIVYKKFVNSAYVGC